MPTDAIEIVRRMVTDRMTPWIGGRMDAGVLRECAASMQAVAVRCVCFHSDDKPPGVMSPAAQQIAGKRPFWWVVTVGPRLEVCTDLHAHAPLKEGRTEQIRGVIIGLVSIAIEPGNYANMAIVMGPKDALVPTPVG